MKDVGSEKFTEFLKYYLGVSLAKAFPTARVGLFVTIFLLPLLFPAQTKRISSAIPYAKRIFLSKFV